MPNRTRRSYSTVVSIEQEHQQRTGGNEGKRGRGATTQSERGTG
jgi:hypothetical protein